MCCSTSASSGNVVALRIAYLSRLSVRHVFVFGGRGCQPLCAIAATIELAVVVVPMGRVRPRAHSPELRCGCDREWPYCVMGNCEDHGHCGIHSSCICCVHVARLCHQHVSPSPTEDWGDLHFEDCSERMRDGDQRATPAECSSWN